MKIIFLTRFDPKDMNAWSGTLYHIYNKLKEKHQLLVIGSEILKQFDLFKKMNYHTNNLNSEDKYIKKLNYLLSERIITLNYDLVFFGDLVFVPFLEINTPIIYLSDTTYEQRAKHIKEKNMKIDANYTKFEKLMLEKTEKIIFSSEWIKKKAIEFYNIDSEKIYIVEFGANIPSPSLLNFSIKIDTDICNLVFIGINWEKKGGDKVVQAYTQLKKEGFACTLTIIGSVPSDSIGIDEDVAVYPFLDKSKPADLEKLCQILAESHFLVLPTQFDAFGIVFCEASAYGVPSIAADVGGVSQAIKEGKNGNLLPADATVSDYAEKIKTVFNDKEGYLKLRQSSRNEFETRLNWDVWGEKVNKILEDAVREYKQCRGAPLRSPNL